MYLVLSREHKILEKFLVFMPKFPSNELLGLFVETLFSAEDYFTTTGNQSKLLMFSAENWFLTTLCKKLELSAELKTLPTKY